LSGGLGRGKGLGPLSPPLVYATDSINVALSQRG